ncbi:MAG: tyrosine protein kinase [Flavobacteriaceae bacterium CG18_big_fil_WC_8_21_14_2_50_34_36]|nr:MAG: tyrosine protein kinase [Flavobacteriaceae bacterium CG18_big_fil_WC_8_21_14_2_50_34_36]PJC06485.1 MAG: tyrosine protein kinase [Flavobacteriaceae bacterium CG_4_9_14_0_8_um_filter_34_30]
MENLTSKTTTVANNEPTLREQIGTYLRHWPWFVLTVLISLIIAYLYLRYTTTFYQTSTSIIIKDSKGRGAASELAAFEDIGLISGMNSNSIENEIEILKSKRLMTNVAKELDLHIRYFKEGKIKVTEFFANKAFSIKIVNEKEDVPYPTYPLYFKITSPTTLEITDSETNTKQEVNFGNRVSFPFADITILPSAVLQKNFDAKEDNTFLVQFANLNNIVTYYQNAIQVSPVVKGGSVIKLTLNDPVKEKAQRILDELVSQYNKDATEDRNLVSLNTAAFIDERLQIITQELDSVETNKVDFKQENRLTDIQAEAQLFLENSSDLNKKQVNLATQLELVNSVVSYLNKEDKTSLLPANLGISEGGIDGLITNYNQLVIERNRLLRSSTEQNPVVVNLTNQINQLRSNVITSLNNVRNSLQVSLRDIRSQEAVFGSKIAQVPGKEKVFRGIERQQGIKEALYLFLLQKREETSISLAVTAPKAKIVDAAYSSEGPVSPKSNIVLLAAFLIGLLIPFSIIYVNQLLYDKVRNRKDVEREVGSIPIVGEIPKLDAKEEVLIKQNDRSILAESFRILRTNLQYLFVNKKDLESGKTIFVTSTVKGEGKTFATVNLALTLANSNKKVVVVGADIRNPQLHRYVPHSKKTKGVTDFLVSKTLNISDLIQKSDFNPHLDFLFSGTIPPNPAELWLNDRAAIMFASLKENYDYIIVDTAPAMLVTDTFLISSFADVTLYVIRADYTERKLLEFPVDAVANKKLQGVAFVLNHVKMANFGYGNKYGYAYGVEKKGILEQLKQKFKR